MKIFPCRRDIKIQKLHPKQGHNRTLYAQLETKMAEVVVSPGKAGEVPGKRMGTRP